jgi:hypothetical protein
VPAFSKRCRQNAKHTIIRHLSSRNSRLFSDYDEDDLVGKEVLPDAISDSTALASVQAEELFCDLFAYACFGPSYLRAFAYILAPGDGTSDAKYPTHSTRVLVIRKVATDERVALPDSRALGFKPDGRRGDARNQFMARAAEAVVAEICDELWESVQTILQGSDVKRPRLEEADRHLKNFRLGIPSVNVDCVGDIINAGWLRYDEVVARYDNARELSDHLSLLNEILLKTIEVFEYRGRLG